MQRVTYIGILSLAKVMGTTGLLLGLIVGVPWGLTVMAMGGSALADDKLGLAALNFGGGLLTICAVALAYAALCYITGLVHALILNLVLYLSGGLVLKIEPGQRV